MRILNENFRTGRRTSVNCYAIFSAGRLALIETGSGDYLLPTPANCNPTWPPLA